MIDGHAAAGLGEVTTGGDRAADQAGGNHQRQAVVPEPADGAGGQQGASGDTDEGVDGIPQAVKAGNLVGEKFGDRQRTAYAEDERVGQHLQVSGQQDPAEVAGHAHEE